MSFSKTLERPLKEVTVYALIGGSIALPIVYFKEQSWINPAFIEPLWLGILATVFLPLISPILTRMHGRHNPLEEISKLDQLKTIFERQGKLLPTVWIRKEHKPTSFQRLCLFLGMSWGRGPFKQALILDPALLSEYSSSELEAVVTRSICRLEPKVFAHRCLGAFVSAFLVVVVAIICATLFQVALGPAHSFFPVVRSLLVLVSALCGFLFAGFLGRTLTFEADERALRLGVRSEALISALKRAESLRSVRKRNRIKEALDGFLFVSSADRVINLQKNGSQRRQFPLFAGMRWLYLRPRAGIPVAIALFSLLCGAGLSLDSINRQRLNSAGQSCDTNTEQNQTRQVAGEHSLSP